MTFEKEKIIGIDIANGKETTCYSHKEGDKIIIDKITHRPTFEGEFKQFAGNIAEAKEIFLIEELQKYMVPDGNGSMQWIETVRLRLQEKKDWERRVKEAIEQIVCEDCRNELKKELGL